ncbi:MAG: hypothetical protein ACOVO9_14760 [Bacteroidia bacterium]
MKSFFYFSLIAILPCLSCKEERNIHSIKLEVVGSQDRPTPVLIIADDSVFHQNDIWNPRFEFFITPKTLREIETIAHKIKQDTTSKNKLLYRAFEIKFIDDLKQSPKEKKIISLIDTRIFIDSLCVIFKRNYIDSIELEKLKYLKKRVVW